MAKDIQPQPAENTTSTPDTPPVAKKPRATTRAKKAVPDETAGPRRRPMFDGLDGSGLPLQREAATIGELPLPEQAPALRHLTDALGKELGLTPTKSIHAGTPVFAAFKDMHRQRAKNHPQAKLLLCDGANVSLDQVSLYMATAGA